MKRNLDQTEGSIDDLLSDGEVELSEIVFQPNGREYVYRPSGQVEAFERAVDNRLASEYNVTEFLEALEDIDHDFDFEEDYV